MPTARELLLQADALMRSNRARATDTDIPELTDVVPLPVPVRSPAPMTLDDVPELTDAVEEIEVASIVELPEDGGDVSEWLRFDRGELSAAGEVPVDDSVRWTGLAEEIRTQVLRRFDTEADADLAGRLRERLQPIVERASAELVATIDEEMGALLRAYVSEVVESEIDRWRKAKP